VEEIAELEEAFKVASRSFEANQEGLLNEVGHEHRRKLDELAAPIAEEVRAEFEKENKRSAPKPTAAQFSDALQMDWPEKSKLIDSLISSA
jgi:predicted  nucleic acid-binding Zn-ribbon protein